MINASDNFNTIPDFSMFSLAERNMIITYDLNKMDNVGSDMMLVKDKLQ